jgi:hypothetical protein
MASTLPRRAGAILASVIVAAIVLCALYLWTVLHWSYSEGERAGYLQTLSKKGWVCKTWEGEILLSSMPGAIPQHFDFTVRDEAVARQMQSAIGKRVQISYSQHVGVPTTCFGDTQYYADKVVVGGDNPTAPSNP